MFLYPDPMPWQPCTHKLALLIPCAMQPQGIFILIGWAGGEMDCVAESELESNQVCYFMKKKLKCINRALLDFTQ
jgi:hypothetical protein